MPRVSKVSRADRDNYKLRLHRSKKIQNPFKKKKDVLCTSSASSSKIKVNTIRKVPEDTEKHYRIIDFLLVFKTLSTLVKCVKCDGKLDFKCCNKEGLGFQIQVNCANCQPLYIPSSEKVRRVYEVNTRFIFIMRILGLGLDGCNKFCGLMDITSTFLSKTTYLEYMRKICASVIATGEQFLFSAAQEEKKETAENSGSDTLTASGDGTWMKQGFSSLFGVTSLIGYMKGKVIDIFVSSLYCQLCKIWDNKLDTEEFKEWHETHIEEGKCQANHAGPSGNMEVGAVIEMFRRSEEKYGAKIENYVGDGDSKTYGNLIKAKPYGDNFIINKKECIGHVQKRMGTRLREVVKNTVEETTVKSGKTAGQKRSKVLGGKGKLTGKMIDNLSRYYGSAIRHNCESVEKMKEAIWATFFHQQSTDENPQHDKCMKGKNSWCAYQKALATGSIDNFKHDYKPLPDDVIKAIKPIYEDLSKDELLERCVGGYTQNANESLNQLIWRIAPKKLSGSKNIVEFAAYIAASTFNEGAGALLTYLDDMGIGTGQSSHEYARAQDCSRVAKADKEFEKESKEARIQRRLQRKEAEDNDIAAGNVLYGAGIDDSV